MSKDSQKDKAITDQLRRLEAQQAELKRQIEASKKKRAEERT